jgi:hypothetical protein
MNRKVPQPAGMSWSKGSAIIGVRDQEIKALRLHHRLNSFPSFREFGCGNRWTDAVWDHDHR